MKRIVASILVAIFPYMVVLYLCWIMNLLPVPFPANWTSASVYICIFLTWLVCGIGAIWLVVLNTSSKTDVRTAARNNMIIKLVQIPAYILLFLVGVVFAMFVFTMRRLRQWKTATRQR